MPAYRPYEPVCCIRVACASPAIVLAASVDAPAGARKIFWNDWRVGWVLTSVRPQCGRHVPRPVWEFADHVQIRTACSKHCVANWLPDPVSRPLRHTLLSTAPTPSTTLR